MPQNKLPVPVKIVYAVILLLLAANLTACATSSPTLPVELPTLPPPPPLSTPLPSASYSLTAAEAIKNWRAKLMGTRLMSSTTETAGPATPPLE